VADTPGTAALATASHSIAVSLGYPDGENIPVDLMIEAVGRVVEATTLPVSADLEGGYGDPAGTVRKAIGVGVVGANIEDQMRPIEEAAANVRAIMDAAIKWIADSYSPFQVAALRSFAAMPLEVVTIALAFRRLRRGSDDLLTRAVVSEVQVLRYAVAGWFEEREKDPRAVTVHERSGYGSIVACIAVLIAAESIGAHFLLQLWSVKAAWIMTALDLYALLWVFGDYHALRLRPTLIGPEAIELRYGLRWSATIARENIAALRSQSHSDSNFVSALSDRI